MNSIFSFNFPVVAAGTAIEASGKYFKSNDYFRHIQHLKLASVQITKFF